MGYRLSMNLPSGLLLLYGCPVYHIDANPVFITRGTAYFERLLGVCPSTTFIPKLKVVPAELPEHLGAVVA